MILTGDITSDFRMLLAKGHFVSKDVIETGDIVEFVYHGERKYMLILNPNYTDARMVVAKIHGVDLSHIDLSQLAEILNEFDDMATSGGVRDTKSVDPELFYGKIKDITSKTRSYRTYIIDDVSRTRIMQYKPIG